MSDEPKRNDDGPGVRRRDVLQVLFGAAGAGVALPSVLEGHPIHEHLAQPQRVATAEKNAAASGYEPVFLDPHLFKTFGVLSEQIVPGSQKANVPEFIDQLLLVDSHSNQRSFLNALGAMEGLAIVKYQAPWINLTPTQQRELLTFASTQPSGRGAAPPREGATVPNAPAKPPVTSIRDHFDSLRGWISGAYYSSEAGLKELGWTGQMFFESYPGCTHEGGHSA